MRNEFIDRMNKYADNLSKRIGFEVRPTVRVIEKILKNSRERDNCLNDIEDSLENNDEQDEYMSQLWNKISNLDRSYEDLTENSFGLMLQEAFTIMSPTENVPVVSPFVAEEVK